MYITFYQLKLTLILCQQTLWFKGIWLFLKKVVRYDSMSKFPISSKTTFSNKWSSSEHTKNLKCVCTLKVIWLCDMISTEACDTRQPSLWPAKHNNHLNFHVLFISHTQVYVIQVFFLFDLTHQKIFHN